MHCVGVGLLSFRVDDFGLVVCNVCFRFVGVYCAGFGFFDSSLC